MKKGAFSILLAAFACFLSISTVTYAQESEPKITSTQILQTTTTWNNRDLSYPAGPAEVTALHIEFEAGSETTWHRHPVASLAYILSGELEVVLKDGQTKIFSAGDAFSEVIDTWHYGKNIGDEPVKLVVFYVGKEGMELTQFPDENPEE